MAEDNLPEPLDLKSDRVGQRGQKVDVFRRQLGSGPRSHLIRDLDRLAASQGHELPVGVAPHEHYAIAERDQPFQDGSGLGAGGVIAGDDHQISTGNPRFSEHGIEDRQHAMNVGQNRDGVCHPASQFRIGEPMR